MKTNITKEQILDYFNNMDCSNCEFKQKCDYNEYVFNAPSICTLFEVS